MMDCYAATVSLASGVLHDHWLLSDSHDVLLLMALTLASLSAMRGLILSPDGG
jgi:hypothetical protein